MQNRDIIKQLGTRIKELRKQKKWTQKELAIKIGIGFSQLNKYECGSNTPPLDKIIHLSEVFNTTIDYLLTGNHSDESPLHNLRLLERFKALESFETDDQESIMKIIDAMIVKQQVEGVVRPHLRQ